MEATASSICSRELLERFARAERVVVLTGAGVSAESGVPTFRGGGQTAVWKGMPFDVISSAGMLARDLPGFKDILASFDPYKNWRNNRMPDSTAIERLRMALFLFYAKHDGPETNAYLERDYELRCLCLADGYSN